MALTHIYLPEGYKVTALPEGYKVTADLPEGYKVTADLPEGCKVTADLPEGCKVTADLPEGCKVTADLPRYQPYVFPLYIATTDQRPDIILWNDIVQEVWVIELTVCDWI